MKLGEHRRGGELGTSSAGVLACYTADPDAADALALATELAHGRGAALTVIAATEPPNGVWMTHEAVGAWLSISAHIVARFHAAVDELPYGIGPRVIVNDHLAPALRCVLRRHRFESIVLPEGVLCQRAVRRALSGCQSPLISPDRDDEAVDSLFVPF